MFTYSFFVLWFSLMSPLIYSPGPANFTVAAISVRSGLTASFSFIAGLSTVNFFIPLIVGLAFGYLYQSLPLVFRLIETIGALYVCYLGYGFFKAKKHKNGLSAYKNEKPDFKKGLLFQFVNGKFYPTLIMMYSQFLENPHRVFLEVFVMTTMILLLALSSYLVWGLMGAAINRLLKEDNAVFVQKYVFGGLLLLVGLWLLVENIMHWLSLINL